MMAEIAAVPITAAAFAPFGQLLERPTEVGRRYFSDGLVNDRASAAPSLWFSRAEPIGLKRLDALRMERHEFSSQSFMPLDVSRYLVITAPHSSDGLPDGDAAQAFIVPGHQGITYAKNVWHHPMVVLDRPGHFAIFMWLDGSTQDEEFVPLPVPFQVTWPD